MVGVWRRGSDTASVGAATAIAHPKERSNFGNRHAPDPRPPVRRPLVVAANAESVDVTSSSGATDACSGPGAIADAPARPPAGAASSLGPSAIAGSVSWMVHGERCAMCG